MLKRYNELNRNSAIYQTPCSINRKLIIMKRLVAIFLIAVLMLLAGCGAASVSEQAQAITGKWAYIHDEETVILRLKSDGVASFHDKDYTYDCDDEYIYLKAEDDELALRYKVDGDKLYIYEQTTYKYDGEGEPEGLIGQWSCAEKKWKFEFTDDGTFMEDGYFPGYYIVDEAEGSFKLIYNDQFEDTVCYYKITGDELMLEYPWCMVKAK